jgi:pimeloyl-ACP methyl ester carboxylesterase
MKKIIGIIIAFLVCGSLGGCVLFELRQDVQFSQGSCLLTGEIISHSSVKNPVVVVAYSRDEGGISIADYAVLAEAGPYEMLVLHGDYEIFAFEDKNGNLDCDQSELAGYYGKPNTVKSPPAGIAYGLDVVLGEKKTPPAASFARLLKEFSGGKRKPPTSAGALANLDDPVFSAQSGAAGFWQPLDFFKRAGCNIYFLEPYDPQKIPILFVHGAAGSPQDWRYFINHLDRSRYQAWVYFYPSGARLQTTSFLLRKKIYDLYMKYSFEQLYVVAHSMGGLVSRPAIMAQDVYQDTLKLFISISTPWGGEERAKTGVEKSPAVIPCWKDVEPGSDYIKSVFAGKMDPSIHYYLFFGHKGSGSLFRPNNDNTVTLESILDSRAQADALKVLGFNEDHVSILSSPDVMARFKDILAGTEANKDKTYSRTKGYLHVSHAFDPPNIKYPSQMALVLAPSGNEEKETQHKINPFLPAQEIGPIQPKKYDVSLVALGFKTEPDRISLDISSGKIADAGFTLKPQGMVAGFIAASTSEDDSFWGLYKELPEKVKIRSIKLSRPGFFRTLAPADEMRDREVLATFLASKDYAYKNSFAFFNLPAGVYDVDIEADGCEVFSTKIEATPGEFIPPAPFRLILK